MPSLIIIYFLAFAAGCSRFHPEHHDMVYVWVRQIYLRDRVAAVSNRVTEVENGQPLEVLEHGRRFFKVKTEKNEIGWVPERAVIDSKTYEGFVQLGNQHKGDPVVANATLRDEMYLHLTPGRDTDRFYILAENAKVQMLMRASIPKVPVARPAVPAKHVAPSPANAKGATPESSSLLPKKQSTSTPPPAPEPAAPDVVMEDWWLVRDGQGHTGWVLGNRVDVDVTDDIAQYAEGQRIVGAYVIAKVNDPESPGTNHQMPEYVTALAPPKSGLPFDFDQIRLFTWSVKHHRYETAFRIHPIQGYLPVRISSEPAPGGSEPVFSFQISSSQDVAIDPDTGIARPASPRTISYALRDTMVHRVGPDMAPIPIIHSEDERPKSADSRKKSHK